MVDLDNNCFERIRRILVNNFNWLSNAKQILPEHRLREDLELDSLGMVNLQVAVEDEFRMRFDPIETDLVEVFRTVGSLVKFLQRCDDKNGLII